MTTNATLIKEAVKERYGTIAKHHQHVGDTPLVALADNTIQAESSCCGPSCCTPSGNVQVESTGYAEALYTKTELNELPDSVTGVSLGCGNPTTIASLKQGETVLDLGSGGGIDCFIAAKAVGPTGYVIGVDMTDDMLALANKNKVKMGYNNVEFRKGDIEDLPVVDNTVDTIISNCVINLAPDKEAVFREAFRVLKPGGRFTVSDIVTQGDIPQILQEKINAWVGCISGAIDQDVYLDKLRQVGFADVAIQSKTSYGIEVLDSLDEATREALTKDVDWSTLPEDARIYSANIIAYKPL